jgi:hypothetical protein
MNTLPPHRTVARWRQAGQHSATPRPGRGQILTGALLLAVIGTAAALSGPAAMAAPSSAAGTAAGKPKPSSTPPPGGSISFSVSPASATAPDHRSTFNYSNVKPGSTISDYVAVLNRSTQSVAFTVYATDATGTTSSDVLTLLPPGKTPTDVGAWARFAHGVAQLSVIIPADRGVIEPFTLTIPRNANPGDHIGALMASVTVRRSTNTGTGVNETSRIGVPILLRVIGPLHAALRVESVSVSYAGNFNPLNDGRATVTYAVQNTGNVLLSGSQAVSVSGPFGAAVARLKSLPVVLPGDAVRFTETTGRLYGAGPLTAHVKLGPTAAPGEPALATPLSVVTASASTFAVPWAILLILIVVIGVVVGGVQGLRYRQRKLQAHVNAVAESVRRETEQRLLGGSGKSAPPGQA